MSLSAIVVVVDDDVVVGDGCASVLSRLVDNVCSQCKSRVTGS